MAENDPNRPKEREVVVGDSSVNSKLIIGVLILIGVLFFVFQNTEVTTFQWIVFDFEMALWVYTLLMFALGIIMGWALHVRRAKRAADKKQR